MRCFKTFLVFLILSSFSFLLKFAFSFLAKTWTFHCSTLKKNHLCMSKGLFYLNISAVAINYCFLYNFILEVFMILGWMICFLNLSIIRLHIFYKVSLFKWLLWVLICSLLHFNFSQNDHFYFSLIYQLLEGKLSKVWSETFICLPFMDNIFLDIFSSYCMLSVCFGSNCNFLCALIHWQHSKDE